MTPHDPKLVRELKDDLLKVWGNLEAGCKDSLALCRAIDFLEAFQSPPARDGEVVCDDLAKPPNICWQRPPPQPVDDREDGSQRVSLYMDILAKKAPGEDAMQELLCKPLVLMELGWQSARAAQSDVKERAEHARINLACLIPDPKNPKIESWPVDNPADAECLQIAYESLMAIKSAEGKNGC